MEPSASRYELANGEGDQGDRKCGLPRSATLCREETVEASLYLARKHQTQIQVVHVAYRNVPLVCMCMWLHTYKSKATINKK